jgi:hypothetical protein
MKGLIGQLADAPQRMTGRDPLLDRHVGEQEAGALLLASHQRVGSCPIVPGMGGLFSELLRAGGPTATIIAASAAAA